MGGVIPAGSNAYVTGAAAAGFRQEGLDEEIAP